MLTRASLSATPLLLKFNFCATEYARQFLARVRTGTILERNAAASRAILAEALRKHLTRNWTNLFARAIFAVRQTGAVLELVFGFTLRAARVPRV